MKRLTLYQDSFLWIKAKYGLIYNTRNSRSYEFPLNHSLHDVCQKLLDYKNLYSVIIDESDLTISRFATVIEGMGMGVVSEEGDYTVSFPPLLCLPQDRRVKKGEYRYEDLMSSLFSICFYMGGMGWTEDYYLQTLYPSSFESFIEPKDIKLFIENNAIPDNVEIKIVFSNIASYPNIEEVLRLFKERRNMITIYVRFDDFGYSLLKEKIQSYGFKVVILCKDTNRERLCELQRASKNALISYITSQSEMLDEVKYVPLFNGSNFDFFYKEVFLTKDEVIKSSLSKRMIFAHQVLNTHYFGKLIVLPNKNVYSNPNKEALGTIETPVLKLIATEFSKNYSWRSIRNSEKCQECLYQGLCPSPTFYEEIMHVDCVMANNE
ncbi:hypothetical protein HDR62_02235 [bacterium]|nr:hypothetical protein [bacterium]